MLKNPAINFGRLAPGFQDRPAAGVNNKICCTQNFVDTATAAKLKAAGITHVWENTALGELDTNEIGICQNYSTAMFGSRTPSDATIISAANGLALYDNMVITDEFAEGDYPQTNLDHTSSVFYSTIGARAQSEGKSILKAGEYGYGALGVHQTWKRSFNAPRDPMNQYFLDLLGPGISGKLDTCNLKTYLTSNMKNIRGRCVSYYYSMESMPIGDYICSIPTQAMYQYNESDQPVIFFTWPKMQSNGHMVDVPQRDAGTRRPNGTIGITYPMCPAEIMKIFGMFSHLFFEGAYLWNDFGVKPDDDDAYNGPHRNMDAFFVGVDWAIRLAPHIAAAGGNILCSDYSVNGQRFSYTGQERRISRKGSPFFNNYYFNQVAAASAPMLMVIPASKPIFIYIDTYSSPLKTKTVTAHYEGKEYKLGTIPGMTLYVSL